MKISNPYRRVAMFLATMLILVALTAIFGYVWYVYYSDIIVQPFWRRGNWMVLGVYALLLFVFTRIYGGYRVGYLKRGDLIYSSILSTLFVNVITYLQVSLIGRMFMPPMPMAAMCVVDVACIILWATWASRLYARLHPPRRMLVIYGSRRVESLIDKMSARAEKYDICEAVDAQAELSAVYERVLEYEAVVICDVKSETRNQLLKFCFEHSVRTYLTPKITDLIVRGAEMMHMFDTPLLLCRNRGLNLGQQFFKRAMDIVLSALALVLASPFMLAVAVAIKCYDGGPVLYKQTRLTLNGCEFEVYKFRSMITDAEKNGVARLSSKGDDRITPVGRVLRKIRFDELPQLFNIFMGDMSIVGPRPERPEISAQYEREMPEFRFRLKVKAGLTGYAQVMGKYNTTPYDKLKLDLMYIENYSLLMDIKLILMTIKILFMLESTEGVAEGALTASDLPNAGKKHRHGKKKRG